ncbi:hypothetical protein H9L19_07450 [Weissella diestrammenae]|uniref:YfhO family protein n=1 Tax=Weissella diestrammenae TaxID=1162633 RepID=A0A7G9T517_9LACO|nr:hypothetical protein [Weissella diestrammenae]MCM0582915.1 hypothetical protein [Weissella diestrammenae]QNN75192.1 hypothetical protein H9L19_07450 [Weissella diestrammenae]
MNMRKERQSGWIYNLIFIVSVFLIALIPLIFFKDFYFLDDSQRAAAGQWYEVGREISNGHLPVLNIAAQGSGNYLAEGQWGTFSPLQWLIGLAVYHSNNFAFTISFLKVITLIVFAMGVRQLATSFGAKREWAFLAGITAPFVGFTLFAGGGSWVTDLLVSAMLPWFWLALRQFLIRRKYIVMTFIVGYSIITIGYVFGTLMMVAVMFGIIIQSLVLKDWQTLRRNILIGIPLGLIAVAVYLPGILVSHVTMRSATDIVNDNFLSPNLGELVTAYSPVHYPELSTWWATGNVTYMPLTYISWILLFVSFVNLSRLSQFIKTHKADLLQLGFPTIISFIFLFGPSAIGPLRFPIRHFAYFGQFTIIIVAVVISQMGIVFSRRRVVAFSIFSLLGGYLQYASTPERVKTILFTNIGIFIGVLLMTWIIDGHAQKISRYATSAFITIAILLTASVTLIQQRVVGRAADVNSENSVVTYHYPKFNMPTTKEKVDEQAKYFVGNSLVLGNSQKTIVGNNWYIAQKPSINVYSPVGFQSFAEDVRSGDPTFVPNSTYKKLFSYDKKTHEKIVDLLSIRTVGISKSTTDHIYSDIVNKKIIPEGWHINHVDDELVVITRNHSVEKAGSVVWTSQNHVTYKEQNNGNFTLRVPASNKATQVVLSRMNWPGYEISKGHANVGSALRKYLLTINVNASNKEQTIEVKYHAPGFSIACILIAVSFGMIILLALVKSFSWKLNKRYLVEK